MYGSRKGYMGPLEELEAISKISSELADHFPDAWVSVRFVVKFMGIYGMMNIDVEKEGGEIVQIELPANLMMKSMELRAGMYKENEGSWFSWELRLWSEGRFKSGFNYDEYPSFSFSPGSEDYLDEMRIFPRSEEFTPGWLQSEINEASRGQ